MSIVVLTQESLASCCLLMSLSITCEAVTVTMGNFLTITDNNSDKFKWKGGLSSLCTCSNREVPTLIAHCPEAQTQSTILITIKAQAQNVPPSWQSKSQCYLPRSTAADQFAIFSRCPPASLRYHMTTDRRCHPRSRNPIQESPLTAYYHSHFKLYACMRVNPNPTTTSNMKLKTWTEPSRAPKECVCGRGRGERHWPISASDPRPAPEPTKRRRLRTHGMDEAGGIRLPAAEEAPSAPASAPSTEAVVIAVDRGARVGSEWRPVESVGRRGPVWGSVSRTLEPGQTGWASGPKYIAVLALPRRLPVIRLSSKNKISVTLHTFSYHISLFPLMTGTTRAKKRCLLRGSSVFVQFVGRRAHSYCKMDGVFYYSVFLYVNSSINCYESKKKVIRRDDGKWDNIGNNSGEWNFDRVMF
jgi:hypothetical protein